MPFVRGESRRDGLDREKQLPIDDALRIAREAASRRRRSIRVTSSILNSTVSGCHAAKE
ncbi:MAG: hypothetical protein WEE89_12955 [Gemmatimonadota bacterium]